MSALGTTGTELHGAKTKLRRKRWLQVSGSSDLGNEWKTGENTQIPAQESFPSHSSLLSQTALRKATQVNVSFRILGMCGQGRGANVTLDREPSS